MNSNIFFTEIDGKYSFDIPEKDFTINDENPEFADEFIVNWTYPLSIYDEDNFRKIFPNLTNPNGAKRRVDHGFIHIYGDLFPCDLKFLGGQDQQLKIQLEIGYGILKVMDKKLSSIDFGSIETDNLYDYIDANFHKKYPETTVFFPRIYTPKDYITEIGSNYGGRNIFNDSDEGVVLRNEQAASGQVIFNIIKPVLYLLHVLKKGFESEGFTLIGDILEDELVQQLGFNHNNIADIIVENNDKKMDVLKYGNDPFVYEKEETFTLVGFYRVSALIPNRNSEDPCTVKISVRRKDTNETLLYFERTKQDLGGYNPSDPETEIPEVTEVFFELPEFTSETEIIYRVEISHLENLNTLVKSGKVMSLYLLAVGNNEQYYYLPSSISLNKFVPDVTFKDVIQAVRKLGHYKIIFKSNKQISFDRISNTPPKDVINLSFTEQKSPEIYTSEKEMYILSYNAPEDLGFSDYVVKLDRTITEGSKDDFENYESIEFNCYPIKQKTDIVGGPTAEESEDGPDGLELIKYSGFQSSSSSSGLMYNNTEELDPYMIITIYNERYSNYIHNRLNADTIKWTFNSTSPVLKRLKSEDSIYAYGAYHKIKNLVKKYQSSQIIEVQFETENRF